MKTLLLALVLATSANAKCITNDRWTGPDKNLHLAAGLFAGAGAMAQTQDPFKGFLFGTAVGALKEVVDSRGSGTCSLQDFAATAVGAAVGAYGGSWLIGYSAGRAFINYNAEF